MGSIYKALGFLVLAVVRALQASGAGKRFREQSAFKE
jgi:hypothetical protein